MSDPPTDASLEDALALGGSRVGSLAHPGCLCGRRKPPLPPGPPIVDEDGVYVGATDPAFREWLTLRREWDTGVYGRRDCPVHAGTAGGA